MATHTLLYLSQCQSPFFALPPELRNRIYEFCGINYTNKTAQNWQTFLDESNLPVLTPYPSLLLACKRVRDEAYPILHAKARIRLAMKRHLFAEPRYELYAVNRLNPPAVRHLVIECGLVYGLVPPLQNVVGFFENVVSLELYWFGPDSTISPQMAREVRQKQLDAFKHFLQTTTRLAVLKLSGEYGDWWVDYLRDGLDTLTIVTGSRKLDDGDCPANCPWH